MSKKLVEFFAGSGDVSKKARSMGFKTFTIDWEQYGGIDLIIDVEKMTWDQVPFVPDVVWLSPDCTTYTIAAISTHRNDRTYPKTPYAVKCDNVNRHWIDILDMWLMKNPDMVFFIENPRGVLRHMPFMAKFKRHTVWYCQYGDDRAKPTDIWTNSKTWIPRPMCRNYKYDSEGNIIDKHCHHASARRGAKTGTQGRKGAYQRSLIPEQLSEEILKSI